MLGNFNITILLVKIMVIKVVITPLNPKPSTLNP